MNRQQIRSKAVRTLFLSAQDVRELVQQRGLVRVLDELSNTIRSDFLRWPEFDKSARMAAHSKDGVIELMPIADPQSFSFKYVNGHPKNIRFGLPTVMAFGVLADVETGAPLLVSELTLPTAVRTAATSALAALHLARRSSRVMALIGNGAQSEFQALAFHHLLGIEQIRVFDTDRAATNKLIRNLASLLETRELEIKVCTSTAEAVRGADIVTTVTADKTNAAILTAGMLEPGMHLNAVGGDCPGKTEIPPEVLQHCKVFVEFEPQTRIEGDIQAMPHDFPVESLWQVLAGKVPGRRSDQEITCFDSVGFALEDFSTLRYLHSLALHRQQGNWIELVPSLADPKDLFGSLPTSSPAGLGRASSQQRACEIND